MASAGTIHVKVIADDVPLARALMEEHRALHQWMVAKLLHTETGRHWSELVEAHDSVAKRLAETP